MLLEAYKILKITLKTFNFDFFLLNKLVLKLKVG